MGRLPSRSSRSNRCPRQSRLYRFFGAPEREGSEQPEPGRASSPRIVCSVPYRPAAPRSFIVAGWEHYNRIVGGPLIPTPLDQLGRRAFAFYPPIVGIEHNEWLLRRATWSDVEVHNR